jgi:uncharacterized protein involved in exopolysaccharide biosynthesis
MRQSFRLLLATAVLGAAVGYGSTLFQQELFASESTVAIIQQRVPEAYVRSASKTDSESRIKVITQTILSRTRLERIIMDFSLYREEREAGEGMEDIVQRMRTRISVVPTIDGFKVSFTDADAKTAMRVTERLGTLFVDENLRDRAQIAEGANSFLESQIDEQRRILIDQEKKLEDARRRGERPSQPMLLEFEVHQDIYRSLVTKSAEAKMSANLERRQIGEQFKIIDQARLPEQPVRTGREKLTIVGALAGLALGIVFMGVRPRG